MTLSYVHTDPVGLTSFAVLQDCSFFKTAVSGYGHQSDIDMCTCHICATVKPTNVNWMQLELACSPAQTGIGASSFHLQVGRRFAQNCGSCICSRKQVMSVMPLNIDDININEQGMNSLDVVSCATMSPCCLTHNKRNVIVR